LKIKKVMSSVSFLGSMSHHHHASVGLGGDGGGNQVGGSMIRGMTESQRRINSLAQALQQIRKSTEEGGKFCESLHRRVRHLDSLTSPASDASAILTQASENLACTLSLMKDAKEKFDTVTDCEPAIQRLQIGARKMCLKAKQRQASHAQSKPSGLGKSAPSRRATRTRTSTKALSETEAMAANFMPDKNHDVDEPDTSDLEEYQDDDDGQDVDAALWGAKSMTSSATDEYSSFLSEQDVYAAADSMEIIRDSYQYFLARKRWKSTTSTLTNLERVHKDGVDAMCLLITAHLTVAGPAVKLKTLPGNNPTQTRANRGSSYPTVSHAKETSVDTRKRLSDALANRDLMKSVGEYEDSFPLDTRQVRELKSVMECLNGDQGENSLLNDSITGLDTAQGIWGSYLGPPHKRPKAKIEMPPSGKVVRTEKVGSGYYSNLTKVSNS